MAAAIRAYLQDALSQPLLAAMSGLYRTTGALLDEDLQILSLLLCTYSTGLEIYRACEGLHPQLGSLPGQSYGEFLGTDMTGDTGGDFFDSLGTPQEGQYSLRQLIEKIISTSKS